MHGKDVLFWLLLLMSLVAWIGTEAQTMGRCEIKPDTGMDSQDLVGTITLTEKGGETTIDIDVSGFDANDGMDMHGFHVHGTGEMGNACKDAGGHYNPFLKTHGGPTDTERHVGDLGNVQEVNGVVKTTLKDSMVTMNGDYSVIGRAIVIHQTIDDLGVNKSFDAGSNTTGNAGGRLGCCKIELVSQGAAAMQLSLVLITASLLLGQFIKR